MGVARMNPRKRRVAIEQASNNTKAGEVAQVGGGSGEMNEGRAAEFIWMEMVPSYFIYLHSFLSRAWPGQIT